MQGWESVCGLVIGITLVKNREICKKSFHVFDRSEIHIQAFVDIINGKLMSGHSSSSTFHDSIISSYYNYPNIRFSNLQISDLQSFKVSKIPWT